MDSPGEQPSGHTPPIDTALSKSGALRDPALRRAGECFPKSMRVHSRSDFETLFHSGKVLADQVLVVHGRATAGDRGGRIGISISKRVGHAPFRNRWKRLIREAYRRLYAHSPALQSLDLVVRPRRGAVPSYAAIERSLSNLAGRLDRQLRRPERG